MSRLVVPDASVLLKWALDSADEPDRARAIDLRRRWLDDEIAIVLPALWAFEAGNVLGRREPRLAGDLLAALIALEIEEAPVSEFAASALHLMRRFTVSFYDASYHALALDRGGVMVTADQRYARKAASAGGIRTLGHWRPA